MSAHDFDLPTECAAALAVLHRRLDGDAVDVPPAVAAHVAGCADCRGRFAAAGRLAAALEASVLPTPPRLLTERIIAAAIADGRRRARLRHWPLAAAALAAAVLLALGLSRPSNQQSKTVTPGPEIVRGQAPDLRKNLAEAGEAVASLTRRAAAEAVGAGRGLVPAVPAPPWPPAIEPTAQPLGDAGVALANGFEPVTTSARRAARLFLRDLPIADAKQD
jgi:predicted anti-sigma-YlaC factor YlaD